MRHVLLAAALLLAPIGAHAWTPISGDRPTWSGAAPYSLNSAGSADLGGFAGTEPIVRQAMDDWTRVSCSGLTTNYRGSTGATPFRYDGNAVIGWIESSWIDDPNAIGITGPSWGGSGAIMDAQMAMNGVNFEWITGSGSGSRVNTYSIVLHEGGHYYGLGHSSDGSASMYYAYGGGISALNADDHEGICTLYPGGGGGTTDCTTTGCPAGQECVSGSCRPIPTGTGEICAPCGSDADCGGGSNRCLRYPEGLRCGIACSSDATCGGGRCEMVSDGSRQCVMRDPTTMSPTCTAPPPGGTAGCTSDASCAAGTRCDLASGNCVPTSTGTGPLGAPCSIAGDCTSGICFAGACTEACDWLNPRSCASGFYCNGSATGVCGEGLCLAGAPGSRGLGAACTADTDCSTLLCDGGVCSEPCLPGGVASCPTGLACQTGSLPGCGACRIAGALGDTCAGNDDCASGICAVDSAGSSFCTRLCDTGSPCPTGFDCVDAGGGTQACQPGGGAGGLGAECSAPDDCLSGICAVGDIGHFCTRTCSDVSPCPASYECVVTADGATHVCLGGRSPAADARGLIGTTTCSTSTVPIRATTTPFLLLLALLLGLGRRRRRA